MTAGFGAGAGAGVVLFTQASQRFRRGALVQLGMTVYAVLLVCVATARTLPMMFLTLFPFGSVYLMVVATCNTTIQLVTAERFRGRVLALYFACFGVCYPLGALLQSWVADHIGLRTTVFFAGLVLCGIVAVWRRGGWLARAVEGTLS